MSVNIRILNEADAGELFRLRRAALLDSPFAFLSSPEDDAATSEDRVREMLKPRPTSIVFGAIEGSRLVGMLGLYQGTHLKAAHKVNLWGMFVSPEFRGQKLGEKLLQAAIAHARTLEGVTDMRLGVTESAGEARHLYEKAGFEVWGVEPDAIRVQGVGKNEYHMRLALR